jgi:hypothetical protein
VGQASFAIEALHPNGEKSRKCSILCIMEKTKAFQEA